MPRGTLEVILVSAKGLHDSDFFKKMDPYVILTYRAQEHRSSVAQGAGSNPSWNESFLFTVSDNVSELNLRLMDKDTFTKDDFLGETNGSELSKGEEESKIGGWRESVIDY
ncbi:16 kDa phloem protein 2-like [Gastrolobium bilobum]|uniref:16 kDa phloem protein 2-like n=1 Tax=Gastrolobium bilobum TaxID=150636 RepID=UPI002AB06F65|nr:16 kDa phloem protein 2-like [Gastrolobium bilobum]